MDLNTLDYDEYSISISLFSFLENKNKEDYT